MKNGLQIKGLIISTLLHLLVIGVLVVGPAFAPKPTRLPETIEIIDFFPLRTTDANIKGGGSPEGAVVPPPVSKPEQTFKELPLPKPEPQPKQVEPQPQRLTPKPEQQTLPSINENEPDTKRPKKTPMINTNLITKKIVPLTATTNNQRKTSATETVSDGIDPAIAQALKNLRTTLGRTPSVTSLSQGKDTTSFYGPGGGGIPYANFKSAVYSIYYNAWHPPSGITIENAVTDTEVVVARDGTVISARIIKPSGDAAMDASVKQALDRVRNLPPLPLESSETQRVLRIKFDLKAKREIG